jgi:hypothetical protein
MAVKTLDSVLLTLALAVQMFAAPPRKGDFTFRIPPQKISLNIANRPVAIAAWGTISVATRGHNEYVLSLELDSDLSDLQQNMTGLLQAQLDKNDACGDRIAIQHAALLPTPPSARAIVQLHYERYACFKALGKRRSRKLVGGNGVIQMKLTPTIDAGKTLRLVPEIESIQADGSLGEVLRGPFGATVREKITKSLLAAMEKGTDRSLTLPPAVQDVAVIDEAEFDDEGSGRLAVALGGQVTITREQIQRIKEQLKTRLSAH